MKEKHHEVIDLFFIGCGKPNIYLSYMLMLLTYK
jgi:hypothetical protein